MDLLVDAFLRAELLHRLGGYSVGLGVELAETREKLPALWGVQLKQDWHHLLLKAFVLRVMKDREGEVAERLPTVLLKGVQQGGQTKLLDERRESCLAAEVHRHGSLRGESSKV